MLTNGMEFVKSTLEDKVTDLENPNCINCSECCSLFTIITIDEFKNYKKLFNGKYKNIYNQSVKRWKEISISKNALNFTCPFITKNKRCAIYSIRPKTCREFHCKASLNKLDKSLIEKEEHKTINDLIK